MLTLETKTFRQRIAQIFQLYIQVVKKNFLFFVCVSGIHAAGETIYSWLDQENIILKNSYSLAGIFFNALVFMILLYLMRMQEENTVFSAKNIMRFIQSKIITYSLAIISVIITSILPALLLLLPIIPGTLLSIIVGLIVQFFLIVSWPNYIMPALFDDKPLFVAYKHAIKDTWGNAWRNMGLYVMSMLIFIIGFLLLSEVIILCINASHIANMLIKDLIISACIGLLSMLSFSIMASMIVIIHKDNQARNAIATTAS